MKTDQTLYQNTLPLLRYSYFFKINAILPLVLITKILYKLVGSKVLSWL